jgi:cardiolipin synthase A/B
VSEVLERLPPPFLILVLLILIDLVVKVIALGLVPERRRTTVGMAWLLLIFLLPGVGLVLFALLGRRTGGRRRVPAEAQAGMIVLHSNVYPPLPPAATGPDWLRGVLALNAQLGWLDPVAGNRVELYADAGAATAAMVAAVADAERFVHLECGTLTWDDVSEPLVTALVAASQRGVSVRLAYDDRASARLPGYATLAARLDGTTVQRPTTPGRLPAHRDLLVVDGRLAFGGWTAPPLPGPELAFRVEGPLAHSLSVVFAADWYLEQAEQLPPDLLTLPPACPDGAVGQVLASGPGLPSDNQLPMLTSLVYGARIHLALTEPLLLPDQSLLTAMGTATRRGVAVELFVGAETNDSLHARASRSGYAALLEAGVRIHRAPGPMTARHLSVDDTVAVVGTAGGRDGTAVSVLLLGPDVVGRLRAVEDRYRAASTEITLTSWRRRPGGQRYLDNVARVAAALR